MFVRTASPTSRAVRDCMAYVRVRREPGIDARDFGRFDPAGASGIVGRDNLRRWAPTGDPEPFRRKPRNDTEKIGKATT